ncbi:MAG: glycosyltransferase, partial [Chloroflexota bacterium]|nr:glycosyltransferase [Chloroflexota bacterium]
NLIRLYNADPAKVTIVPCGFDRTEFWPMSKALVRVPLGLAPDERVVLQLGRIVPRKGIDNAIRGFARLQRDHCVAAKLLVVGGESEQPDPAATPELARLQKIATREGVADQVVFVGRRGRDTLKYYYSAADVFVTTPTYEPFGITPLEAMACGTPVVGSNVGGIKFTVRDGETGYLVPPDDPDALAERLAHLFRHPKLLSVFRRQAIRRTNDLFTWQKVTGAVAALYESVLAEREPVHLEEARQIGIVERSFDGAIAALEESRRLLRGKILEAAGAMSDCFNAGGTVLICGNGGSAAEAQHFAAEFVGRFKRAERPPLAAIALSADSAVLTAWSNDAGYESVFARQVQALGRPGDVLVAISTSGRSANVVQAFDAAKSRGMLRIALVGGDGGELRDLADIALIVPVEDTQHIQETHTVLIHLLCELVEERLSSARTFAAASPVRDMWRIEDRETERVPSWRSIAAASRGRQ